MMPIAAPSEPDVDLSGSQTDTLRSQGMNPAYSSKPSLSPEQKTMDEIAEEAGYEPKKLRKKYQKLEEETREIPATEEEMVKTAAKGISKKHRDISEKQARQAIQREISEQKGELDKKAFISRLEEVGVPSKAAFEAVEEEPGELMGGVVKPSRSELSEAKVNQLETEQVFKELERGYISGNLSEKGFKQFKNVAKVEEDWEDYQDYKQLQKEGLGSFEEPPFHLVRGGPLKELGRDDWREARNLYQLSDTGKVVRKGDKYIPTYKGGWNPKIKETFGISKEEWQNRQAFEKLNTREKLVPTKQGKWKLKRDKELSEKERKWAKEMGFDISKPNKWIQRAKSIGEKALYPLTASIGAVGLSANVLKYPTDPRKGMREFSRGAKKAEFGFMPSPLQSWRAGEKMEVQVEKKVGEWPGGKVITELSGAPGAAMGVASPITEFAQPRTPDVAGAVLERTPIYEKHTYTSPTGEKYQSELDFLAKNPVYTGSALLGEYLFGKGVEAVAGKGYRAISSSMDDFLVGGSRILSQGEDVAPTATKAFRGLKTGVKAPATISSAGYEDFIKGGKEVLETGKIEAPKAVRGFRGLSKGVKLAVSPITYTRKIPSKIKGGLEESYKGLKAGTKQLIAPEDPFRMTVEMFPESSALRRETRMIADEIGEVLARRSSGILTDEEAVEQMVRHGWSRPIAKKFVKEGAEEAGDVIGKNWAGKIPVEEFVDDLVKRGYTRDFAESVADDVLRGEEITTFYKRGSGETIRTTVLDAPQEAFGTYKPITEASERSLIKEIGEEGIYKQVSRKVGTLPQESPEDIIQIVRGQEMPKKIPIQLKSAGATFKGRSSVSNILQEYATKGPIVSKMGASGGSTVSIDSSNLLAGVGARAITLSPFGKRREEKVLDFEERERGIEAERPIIAPVAGKRTEEETRERERVPPLTRSVVRGGELEKTKRRFDIRGGFDDIQQPVMKDVEKPFTDTVIRSAVRERPPRTEGRYSAEDVRIPGPIWKPETRSEEREQEKRTRGEGVVVRRRKFSVESLFSRLKMKKEKKKKERKTKEKEGERRIFEGGSIISKLEGEEKTKNKETREESRPVTEGLF